MVCDARDLLRGLIRCQIRSAGEAISEGQMALGDLPFLGQILEEIHELAWFLGFLICFPD